MDGFDNGFGQSTRPQQIGKVGRFRFPREVDPLADSESLTEPIERDQPVVPWVPWQAPVKKVRTSSQRSLVDVVGSLGKDPELSPGARAFARSPDPPRVTPTSAAFGPGAACFVYTIAEVPEVFGTPALPASASPTCVALVFAHTEEPTEATPAQMRAVLQATATSYGIAATSDFDAVRALAREEVLLVGPDVCDAGTVLTAMLAPPEDFYDAPDDTASSESPGIGTPLLVAGALAAYYLLAEKG